MTFAAISANAKFRTKKLRRIAKCKLKEKWNAKEDLWRAG